MVNVVCLKWGNAYGSHYVNRLYRGVARNLTLPFRFVCFTDDPAGVEPPVECLPLPPIRLLPSRPQSAHRKLALFAETLFDLEGATLFLDLDMIIAGSIDCFFEYPGEFCIIHNWIERRKALFRPRPHIGNSSVFRFTVGRHAYILDYYNENIERATNDYPAPQVFLSEAVREMTFWPEEWCRSFKRHCIPTIPFNLIRPPQIPPGARIVVFHGRPNPDEAVGGYVASWRKRTLPAPWIERLWV